MQHRFLSPVRRLCRLQRWLAGLDAQFQNGLGVSRSQRTATSQLQAKSISRMEASSQLPSRLVEVTKAQPRSCSNQWPSRLSLIARAYVRQWQRAVVNPEFDFSADTSDGGGMYRLSRCVLLAHEDKVFQGAIVASMSIPWGETKGDNDLGGYHLVWTRDLVHSATALLATGQTSTPLRALIWLAAIQRPDGSFPQNSWIDGDRLLVGVAARPDCVSRYCWRGVCTSTTRSVSLVLAS